MWGMLCRLCHWFYDVNPYMCVDQVKDTPLSLVIQLGLTEVMQALLDAGANPNIAPNGLPPLCAAVWSQDLSVVKALIAADAIDTLQMQVGPACRALRFLQVCAAVRRLIHAPVH